MVGESLVVGDNATSKGWQLSFWIYVDMQLVTHWIGVSDEWERLSYEK